jgi:hypothetical protein
MLVFGKVRELIARKLPIVSGSSGSMVVMVQVKAAAAEATAQCRAERVLAHERNGVLSGYRSTLVIA